MAARSDYALPFALLSVGGLLAYSGFKGKSISQVLAGDIGGMLNPAGGSANVSGGSGGVDATTPTNGAPAGGANGLAYPLPSKGTLIATPADHAKRPFHNWQSDNAVDIGVPAGTSVFAVEDGTITRLGGAWRSMNANPNGLNVTLKGASNTWFYTHLQSRANLKIGDKVTKGQFLGKSGGANGVEHLHIGSETGDPVALLGVK
jgi:murein DD-endopeptidase MepM/ murein hydrolase activator NlpD